jgi:hypothetical protein
VLNSTSVVSRVIMFNNILLGSFLLQIYLPVCTYALLANSLVPSSTTKCGPKFRTTRLSKYPSTTSISMFDFFKGKTGDSPSPKKESESVETSVDDFSDDPVDKIFSFFFGQKEESPMGLKRFGRGAYIEGICPKGLGIHIYC